MCKQRKQNSGAKRQTGVVLIVLLFLTIPRWRGGSARFQPGVGSSGTSRRAPQLRQHYSQNSWCTSLVKLHCRLQAQAKCVYLGVCSHFQEPSFSDMIPIRVTTFHTRMHAGCCTLFFPALSTRFAFYLTDPPHAEII